MNRNAVILAILTLGAFLTGCGIEKLPITPHDVAKLATKVEGIARNEVSGNDTEGRTYELVAEARRDASWNDADYAMWQALQHSCPDGRDAATVSWSPDGRTEAQRAVVHPEGTVFRRVITCPPPPEFEFVLAEGLGMDDVRWLFHERLNEGNEGFPRDPVIKPFRFGPAQPKYPAIERALGEATLQWIEKCDGGAGFSRVAVGVFPPLPAGTQPPSRPADGYIGFVVDCIESETGESLP